MAFTTQQLAERLLKKSQGVAETNYPLTTRGVLEEPIPTYSQVSPNDVWADADSIPETPPILANEGESGVVKYYLKLQLQIVDGSTVVAFKSPNGELEDAISGRFGFGYNFKVYDTSGTTQIFKGDWLVDVEAGVLIFYNTGLTEATVSASYPPTITFYKYIGRKGIFGGTAFVAGSGLTYDSGSTVLDVNVDNETVKIVSDQIRTQKSTIQSDKTTTIASGTTGSTNLVLNYDPVGKILAYINGIEYLVSISGGTALTDMPFYFDVYPPTSGSTMKYSSTISGFDLDTLDLIVVKYNYIDNTP